MKERTKRSSDELLELKRKLLIFLTENSGRYSINELANIFGIRNRRLYDFLKEFKKYGFEIKTVKEKVCVQKLADYPNKGYNYEKRSYKMFTFSKLYGDCSVRDGKIIFKNAPLGLYISSVESDFMQYVLETVVMSDEVRLVPKYVKVQNVEIYDSDVPNFGKITTFSPITVYKTDINQERHLFQF